MPRHISVKVGAFDPPTPPPPPGEWPTAATTGPRIALTNSSMVYPTPGATYSGLNFTNAVVGNADNVTFTDCRFTGGFDFDNCDGSTVEYCDFPKGMALSSARDCLVDWCSFTNMAADGIHINHYGGLGYTTDCTIRNTYISQSVAVPPAHSDGIQVRGSLRLTVDNCYIDMGPVPNAEVTSAFYLEAVESNNDFTVTNSFFRNGYGYSLYIHSPGGPGGTFSYNTVSDDGFGALYAAVPSDLGIVAVGNVLEDGTPLDIFNP